MDAGDASGEAVPAGVQFRTSSFCTSGSCVEVGLLPEGGVAVRDSKGCDTVLVYSSAEWCDFIAGVKNGEFDLA